MVKKLGREELERLSTQRLLAYRNKLLQAHETGQNHDSNCQHSGPDECDGGCGWSKAHPEWKELYATVKSILATREHLG